MPHVEPVYHYITPALDTYIWCEWSSSSSMSLKPTSLALQTQRACERAAGRHRTVHFGSRRLKPTVALHARPLVVPSDSPGLEGRGLQRLLLRRVKQRQRLHPADQSRARHTSVQPHGSCRDNGPRGPGGLRLVNCHSSHASPRPRRATSV